MLWRDGEAIDLNEVVTGAPEGFVLRTAESVNERGDIVGFGTRADRTTHAFLLLKSQG